MTVASGASAAGHPRRRQREPLAGPHGGRSPLRLVVRYRRPAASCDDEDPHCDQHYQHDADHHDLDAGSAHEAVAGLLLGTVVLAELLRQRQSAALAQLREAIARAMADPATARTAAQTGGEARLGAS